MYMYMATHRNSRSTKGSLPLGSLAQHRRSHRHAGCRCPCRLLPGGARQHGTWAAGAHAARRTGKRLCRTEAYSGANKSLNRNSSTVHTAHFTWGHWRLPPHDGRTCIFPSALEPAPATYLVTESNAVGSRRQRWQRSQSKQDADPLERSRRRRLIGLRTEDGDGP